MSNNINIHDAKKYLRPKEVEKLMLYMQMKEKHGTLEVRHFREMNELLRKLDKLMKAESLH